MKKIPQFQKPVILAALFFVMIMSLALAMQYFPGREAAEPVVKQDTKKEIRSGTQVASITILPEGEEAPSSETSEAGTEEGSDETDQGESGEEESTSETAGERREPGVDSALIAGRNVTFAIDRFQLLASQPLKFNVFDDNGVELGPDYLETQRGGAKVHFFLVHNNMQLFHHILPNYSGGYWNALSFMPWTGTYYAYVMVDPLRGDPVVYRYDLVVRNESPEDQSKAGPRQIAPEQDSSLYSATIELKKFDHYRGFLYDVQRGGQPAVITPHNDAIGEMTIFSHRDPSFIRVVTADAASQEGLGKISYSMKHLPKGRYTAFMEVNIDGSTRTFAHTFDIGSSDDQADNEVQSSPDDSEPTDSES